MATATEQLIALEDRVLDAFTSVQQPIVDFVGNAARRAEQYVPSVPAVPGSQGLPPVSELLVSQFAFAEKLLLQQKELTVALLEAIKPVTDKVAPDVKVVGSDQDIAA